MTQRKVSLRSISFANVKVSALGVVFDKVNLRISGFLRVILLYSTMKCPVFGRTRPSSFLRFHFSSNTFPFQVFHVCAFTDDGLIMKSFLCPESTLFDQSILKCNWWFYVDCKSSKKLYDSNIPISKSYQLMKALTFFSTYNKQR